MVNENVLKKRLGQLIFKWIFKMTYGTIWILTMKLDNDGLNWIFYLIMDNWMNLNMEWIKNRKIG